MKRRPNRALPLAAAFLVSLSLSSCFDDSIDLSDIDSTTQLTVNDLTIPLNLADIYLDNIIDTDDSDPDAILKVREIDGKKFYFFTRQGSFNSEPKTIERVKAPAPAHVQSNTVNIQLTPLTPSPARRNPTEAKHYKVTPYHTTFTYEVGRAGNPAADPALQSIADATLAPDSPLRIGMTFSSGAVAAKTSKVEVSNLTVTVPTSVHAYYDGAEGRIESADGHLTIPYLSSTTGQIPLYLYITKIDFTSSENPQGLPITNGQFDFSENVGVESGTFTAYPLAGMSLPEEIDFHTDYDLSSFQVSAFSGLFDYAIDFDPINPFEIKKDLPEFLDNPQTDLTLSQPLLTLSLTSPIASYGVGCEAGLTLTATRSEAPARQTVLPLFKVNPGVERQFIVLAPTEPDANFLPVPAGYQKIFTPFPGLEGVLAGAGLPDRLEIDFKSPAMPKPRVKGFARNFPLGTSLQQAAGEYCFQAPLALADGSRIVYSKTEDGWSDDTLEAVTVTSMKICANLTTNIPAGVALTIRPVNTKGERIPLAAGCNPTATLAPLAQNAPIELLLEGDIRDLDGIYIEAVCDQFAPQPLSPSMTIKVSDLRATVSGSYTKKL